MTNYLAKKLYKLLMAISVRQKEWKWKLANSWEEGQTHKYTYYQQAGNNAIGNQVFECFSNHVIMLGPHQINLCSTFVLSPPGIKFDLTYYPRTLSKIQVQISTIYNSGCSHECNSVLYLLSYFHSCDVKFTPQYITSQLISQRHNITNASLYSELSCFFNSLSIMSF